MELYKQESIKYLFDHIKSIWTLSAGGLPLGIGFFGYILQNAHFGSWFKALFALVCLLGLSFFIFSIYYCVTAQKDMLKQVRLSETEGQTDDGVLGHIMSSYRRGRKLFFLGSSILAGVAVLFLIVSTIAASPKSDGFTVSLKNVKILTQDSREIDVEDATFQVQDPGSAMGDSRIVEIRDLILKVHILQSAP